MLFRLTRNHSILDIKSKLRTTPSVDQAFTVETEQQRATNRAPTAGGEETRWSTTATQNPVEQQIQGKAGTRPRTSSIEGSPTHQRRLKVTPKTLYSSLHKATGHCKALVMKPLQNIWRYSQQVLQQKPPRYVSQVWSTDVDHITLSTSLYNP